MNHRARKRFGQHFLTAGETIADIVAAIDPQAGDTLVEIGPGQAAITAPLAASGARLHAIELDRDLAAALGKRFEHSPNVRVHAADALQFDFAALGDSLRLVGNLPYNISTPLLFHLLAFSPRIRDIHFMLQKEVVDRMTAAPGNKDFGRLTVMLGARLEMLHLFDVPPTAFTPPPRVTSAVVRARPLPADHYDIADAGVLDFIVRQAFSKRRKTLRNALRGAVDEKALEAAGLDPGSRPEQVAIPGWIRLAGLLAVQK